MTRDSVTRALAAAQAWLAQQEAPEATIGACEAGLDECQRDAPRRIKALVHLQRPSGAWDDDL
ncbi:MAG TPA: hypothetical protein VK966_12205, partial [Longimicrobiales bacterium]|nr:hypothetical protein [Longimicrobiales bacterium]